MKYILLILFLVSQAQAGRKLTCGFENWMTKSVPLFYKTNAPDGFAITQFGGIANVVDGRARSTYAANFTVSSSTRSQIRTDLSGLTAPQYLRIWLKLASSPAPTSNTVIIAYSNATNGLGVTWKTDGRFGFGDGSISATTANPVRVGQWILCKLYTNWPAVNDTEYIITDALVAPETLKYTGAHVGTIPNIFQIGCLTTPSAGTGTNFFADDIAINDGSGSFENGFPEDTANVIYLPPQSDNARTGWTTGSGGTSNLYANLVAPPAGTSTDGVVITDVQNSATDNYDVNCTPVNSYTDVSGNFVPAGNAIRLMFACVRDGEHASTGTETGAISLQGNPTESGENTFTFGNDGGAHFTDAQSSTNLFWTTHNGTVQYFPTVNRSSNTVVRVGKRTATTNGVCVDNIGYIIEIGSYAGSGINPPIFEIGD